MSTYLTKRAKELGLRKVDARAALKLEVMSNDVKASVQKNSKCCAFARAAKRMPGVKAAYFFRSTAWLEYEDKLVRYTLPPSVQKEIVSFDRSKVMAAGVYQLSKPQKSTRMSEVQKRSAKRPGRHRPAGSKIVRKIRHATTSIRTLQEPSRDGISK